jgi:hypothetical protein
MVPPLDIAGRRSYPSGVGTGSSVCAWCGAAMGAVEGNFDDRFPVTHGICGACSRTFAAEPGRKSFQEFIDGLGVPLLLVDDDVRVLAANWQARDALGKDLPNIVGRKSGDVIECRYSGLVGGCGQTAHCRSCTIRNCVAKTNLTGKPCLKVLAHPDVEVGAEFKTLNMLISTEKVGACVLLRIDEISAAP